jgi:hypothetical protein
MSDMRKPIDLHGLQCVVHLPSSIYSLEAHENLPHERFAHNVFRIGVEAMHSKGMPEAFIVDFSSGSDFPAWAINASIQAERNQKGALVGFKIMFSELLPTMLIMFAHLVSSRFADEKQDIGEKPSTIRQQVQKFLDVINVGIRAYRQAGLASAIRSIYESANFEMANLQECFDDFDAVCQFIANHELAHAYLGQLQHTASKIAVVDAKAFELCADLLATHWLFVEYVVLTPDTDEYRKMRGLESYADCLAHNVAWLIRTHQCIAILMSLASAQLTGEVGLPSGMRHPSGLGRNVLQTLWLMRLSEWFLGERTSTKTVAEVNERIFDSSKLMAQTGIASRADVDEMLSDSEMELSQRAADLIEELDLRELKPGIGFLRSRHDEATKFRKEKQI